MSEQQLNGKVALVTGASSGMGRATSIGLAVCGAKVVCCDLQAEANPAGFETDLHITTADLIKQKGGNAIFQKVDISKLGELEAAFEKAISVLESTSLLS